MSSRTLPRSKPAPAPVGLPIGPDFPPTPEAARARLAAVRPGAYAATRNALDGAVTRLSPYITHGFLTLPEVLRAMLAAHPLPVRHKLVYELGWRAYFRHVWADRGDGILESLHEGPLPDAAYGRELPADVRQARTGVPVIDRAVQTLYAEGWLHNHARMWLASYLVHVRKVHWRTGADWMFGHLLDGDLASNHLSWQWVAGTGSRQPYLFNAENVAKFAPGDWHSPGSVVDADYDTLDRRARDTSDLGTGGVRPGAAAGPGEREPALRTTPPARLGFAPPDAAATQAVAGREVWLVHPWSLGPLPATLPPGTVVVAVLVDDFHRHWPWSTRRWDFVGTRLRALSRLRWHADAATLGAVLASATRVRMLDDRHLGGVLAPWVESVPAERLFPVVEQRCESFSQWWNRATDGLGDAQALLR